MATKNRFVLLIATCCFAHLGACSGETTSAPTATVRDSAGVAIVENRGSIAPEGGGWSLAAEPSVVIGGVHGPEDGQLFRVHGARRLPDGRIAVANEGTHEIRIYGADGTYASSLGGEGEGPGEFKAVILAGRSGDTLVVLDRRLRRISLIHPDDGLIRSFRVAEPVAAYPLGAWFFQSGSVLIRDLPMEVDILDEGFHRNPVPLRSCDMAGMLLTDFGNVPGAEQVTVTGRTSAGLVTALESVPFGRSPQIAVAGDRLYLGTQDAYEIKVLGSDGSLRRIVRLDRAPVPVTDGDREAYIDQEVAGIDQEDEQLQRRQALENMPRVELRPPYGAIAADAKGYLLVEDFRAPGASAVSVNIFDPTGKLTGHLTLPARFEILEIGDDYVLGLHRDEMDVEDVRLYELVRAHQA